MEVHHNLTNFYERHSDKTNKTKNIKNMTIKEHKELHERNKNKDK